MAKETAQEKEWAIEDAARTLMKAEEIKTDGELFKKATKKLREQQDAIGKAIVGVEKITDGEHKGRYKVKKR